MAEQQGIQLGEKTGVKISSVVAIGLIGLVGAASAAGFLYFGSQAKTSTPETKLTTTKTSPTIDLSTQETPKADYNSTISTTDAATVTNPASDVTVRITSPTEGAIVNGATPITVELTDPNHRATAVRVLLYGELLPDYMQGVSFGNDATPPYTFTPNLAMYPSGEYLYVAQALIFDPSIPGADTAVPIASSDTMVTWNRACYWLAYQDMSLNPPAESVIAGASFTISGTVKNFQRGNCQHVYNLTTHEALNPAVSLLPDGWTATLDPATMNLGINETKTFQMTVQVPSSATAGTYSVGATSALQYTGFVVTKKVDVNVRLTPLGGSLQPN